jgi:hypothetical protein
MAVLSIMVQLTATSIPLLAVEGRNAVGNGRVVVELDAAQGAAGDDGIFDDDIGGAKDSMAGVGADVAVQDRGVAPGVDAAPAIDAGVQVSMVTPLKATIPSEPFA